MVSKDRDSLAHKFRVYCGYRLGHESRIIGGQRSDKEEKQCNTLIMQIKDMVKDRSEKHFRLQAFYTIFLAEIYKELGPDQFRVRLKEIGEKQENLGKLNMFDLYMDVINATGVNHSFGGSWTRPEEGRFTIEDSEEHYVGYGNYKSIDKVQKALEISDEDMNKYQAIRTWNLQKIVENDQRILKFPPSSPS